MDKYNSKNKKQSMSDAKLYNMITTDFEFDFMGHRVKVVSDYEKVDRYKTLVQLVKVSDPSVSFGVHDKSDIVNYIKNIQN